MAICRLFCRKQIIEKPPRMCIKPPVIHGNKEEFGAGRFGTGGRMTGKWNFFLSEASNTLVTILFHSISCRIPVIPVIHVGLILSFFLFFVSMDSE